MSSEDITLWVREQISSQSLQKVWKKCTFLKMPMKGMYLNIACLFFADVMSHYRQSNILHQCWNFSFLATKSVSQFTWKEKHTFLLNRTASFWWPNYTLCGKTDKQHTSTMTAALSPKSTQSALPWLFDLPVYSLCSSPLFWLVRAASFLPANIKFCKS